MWGPDGRYELGEPLARDAVGSVWRGRVRRSGEPVAIRLARIGSEADPWRVDRLAEDWPGLAAVRHPALISDRDLLIQDGTVGLVTDLVDGTTLRERLDAAGPMAPARAAALTAELASALTATHVGGLVHTAITSDNVLVGGVETGWLADLATVRLTRAGTDPAAAPEYAAPELIQTRNRVAATDVYALGVVLYEMLTGVTPYEGRSTEEVFQRHLREDPVWPLELPSGLRYVLGRCLQRDPGARPWAAAVAADLHELRKQLAEIPPAARPRASRPPRPPQRAGPPLRQAAKSPQPRTVGGPAAAGGLAAGPRPPIPHAPPAGRGAPPGRSAAPPAGSGGAPPPVSGPPDAPVGSPRGPDSRPAAGARNGHAAGPPAADRTSGPGLAGGRAADAVPDLRHSGSPNSGRGPGGGRVSGDADHRQQADRGPASFASPDGDRRPASRSHSGEPTVDRRGYTPARLWADPAAWSDRSTLVRVAAAASVVVTAIVLGLVVFQVVGGRDDSGSPDEPVATRAGRTPTSQPSRSASSVPTLAAAGTERTPEGASAFASYWFQLLNHATRTGDVSKLQTISSKGCAECQRAVDAIRRGFAGGGRLQGGSYGLRAVNYAGISGIDDPSVDVVFDRSPRSSIGPDGKPRGSLPGVSFVACRVLLQWTNGKWQVLTITSPDPIA